MTSRHQKVSTTTKLCEINEAIVKYKQLRLNTTTPNYKTTYNYKDNNKLPIRKINESIGNNMTTPNTKIPRKGGKYSAKVLCCS